MNIYFSFHPIPHGEWGEITILEIDHKQTLKTYVQMVCKFKCVHYGPIKKNQVLLFGRPYKVQSVRFLISKILRLVNFQAMNPKYVLALEPKVLQLEGSSFGNRLSISVLKSCRVPIEVCPPSRIS